MDEIDNIYLKRENTMSREPSQIFTSITSKGPHNNNLFLRSQKAFNELVSQVRKITQTINVASIQEVGNFIVRNLTLRIIEQRGREVIFVRDYGLSPSNGEPRLPVAFYADKTSIMRSGINPNAFAFYSRQMITSDELPTLGNFIGLRNPTEFTVFFQAINVFHEAKHALDSRQKADYDLLSSDDREGPAHVLEILILYHYGDQALIRLAMKYVKEIIKKHGKSPRKCDSKILENYISSYDTRLDQIFGKAASDREKHLRMDRFICGFVANDEIELDLK